MEKPHEHSLSRFNKKKKEPSIKSKSLLNVADLNTQTNTNEIKKFVKKLNMFEDASKGDKNMRDIIQGLQLKDKIPDFIKKDTGGILEKAQKAIKVKSKKLSNIADIIPQQKQIYLNQQHKQIKIWLIF
jgi:hypothetical protein